MLKIKKVKLSGFRGILTPQELNLIKGNIPTSLVVYGLNSSGKTSFVDGIEWFLSPSNEIEWLKRENAGCNSYPHLEAKKNECYVEIEFINEQSKSGVLVKAFDLDKVTMPRLSNADGFKRIYDSFIIRPYFRYLEIIDFVFNRTGVEKYRTLANWMGFEYELDFQEKIALHIFPELKRYEKQLSFVINNKEQSIKSLIGDIEVNNHSMLNFCNTILQKYNKDSYDKIDHLVSRINDLDELKSSSSKTQKVTHLTRMEVNIDAILLDSSLKQKIEQLDKQLDEFARKKELTEKIDYIILYERAADILDKEKQDVTECPLCGNSWNKSELINHIKDELALLQSVKEEQDRISDSIKSIRLQIRTEQEKIKRLVHIYEELSSNISSVEYSAANNYLQGLNLLENSLDGTIFVLDFNSYLQADHCKNTLEEKVAIKQLIIKEKSAIQPSKDELIRNEDIEKVKKLVDLWKEDRDLKSELITTHQEIEKFTIIANELSKYIQNNVTDRFKTISSVIEKYFSILRNDKDIKNIEITLNQDRAKVAGRSAEIQLSYYNISVKPAYKVLSESLLNSLGLAVYFTCIKQFNHESKFIVLDDIMNSLDIDHRDTLLDLLQKEFEEYQIILFTHDLHWFEKIQRRFPNWVHKKIKSWTYASGPRIDMAKTTKEEIDELLEDDTKVKDAGHKFGNYVEGILNELCEDLHAELRYRYTKNEPPSMEELFTALYKRMKDKLGNHPVVEKLENAKKYEPLLRNATAHPRQNYSSSISPNEVKRAMEEWRKVEDELFCRDCNRYVEYKKDSKVIECRTGHLKLTRT